MLGENMGTSAFATTVQGTWPLMGLSLISGEASGLSLNTSLHSWAGDKRLGVSEKWSRSGVWALGLAKHSSSIVAFLSYGQIG